MKNCVDEGILQAWFDGELPANEAASVAAHLSGCEACSATATAVETESLTLREALSPEFSASVPTERLRARVDSAVAGLQQAQAPAVRASRWDPFTHFFGSFRPLAYASVAAVILVAAIAGFVYLKKQKPVSLAYTPPPEIVAPRESPAPVAPQFHADLVKSDSSHPPRLVVMRKPKPARPVRAEEPNAMSLAWQQRQYEYAIAKLTESLKYQPPMAPALRVEYEYNMAVADNTIAATREAASKDPLANQFMLAAYQSKVDLLNEIAASRPLPK